MNTIYYRFENFCFKNERLIKEGGDEIALAPKERAVLLFLLEHASSVVSKENLINKVWKGGVVSDESLTRCVYVLRRALGQTTGKRFIETVYGRGYRFLPTVKIFDETESARTRNTSDSNFIFSDKYNIALFPFEMKKEEASAVLHDQLIEWLQSLKSANSMPVNIISSFFTRALQDYNKFLLAIEKSKADYFIVGTEVDYGEKSIMRIELVRAKDHSVIHREGVQLMDDYDINYQSLCRAISFLLSLITPQDTISKSICAQPSLCGRSTRNNIITRCYSVSILKKCIPLIICETVGELCEAARSYYAIVNLGLVDGMCMRSEINAIFEAILYSEQNEAVILSLQGLCYAGKDAEEKFNLAIFLSPGTAEIYYYYACYLAMQGDYIKARKMNNICLEINSAALSAKILKIIIFYLEGYPARAEKYGKSLLYLHSPFSAFVNALLSLICAREGELRQVKSFFQSVAIHKIAVNL